jgi:flagellar protein FliO/FliZ
MAPAPVVAPPAATATAPFVKVDIDQKILANTDSDENLAMMANKLEAALRRPNEPRFTEPLGSMKAEPMAPPPRFTLPEPRAPRVEVKPAPKAVYDSLEEEMASLLGRPPGKS